MGNTVIRQNHVGDWEFTQFGMLVAYLVGSKGAMPRWNPPADLERLPRRQKCALTKMPPLPTPRVNTLWSARRRWNRVSVVKRFVDISSPPPKPFMTRWAKLRPKMWRAIEIQRRLRLWSMIWFKVGRRRQRVVLDGLQKQRGEPAAFIVQKQAAASLRLTDLACLRFASALHADRLLCVVDHRQPALWAIFTIRKAGYLPENVGAALSASARWWARRQTVQNTQRRHVNWSICWPKPSNAPPLWWKKNPGGRGRSRQNQQTVGIGAVRRRQAKPRSVMCSTGAMLVWQHRPICVRLHRVQRVREKQANGLQMRQPFWRTTGKTACHELLGLKTYCKRSGFGVSTTSPPTSIKLRPVHTLLQKACPDTQSQRRKPQQPPQLANSPNDTLKQGLDLLGIDVLDVCRRTARLQDNSLRRPCRIWKAARYTVSAAPSKKCRANKHKQTNNKQNEAKIITRFLPTHLTFRWRISHTLRASSPRLPGRVSARPFLFSFPRHAHDPAASCRTFMPDGIVPPSGSLSNTPVSERNSRCFNTQDDISVAICSPWFWKGYASPNKVWSCLWRTDVQWRVSAKKCDEYSHLLQTMDAAAVPAETAAAVLLIAPNAVFWFKRGRHRPPGVNLDYLPAALLIACVAFRRNVSVMTFIVILFDRLMMVISFPAMDLVSAPSTSFRRPDRPTYQTVTGLLLLYMLAMPFVLQPPWPTSSMPSAPPVWRR